MALRNQSQPRNVGELFADKEWRKKLLLVVRKFAIKDDPEDVLSEIFLLMLSREDPDRQGRDYVERWDPTRSGSFSNWILTFVRNFCIKKYKRSKSAGGRAIEGAKRIVPSIQEDQEARGDQVADDKFGKESCEIKNLELVEAILAIASKLEKQEPAFSWVEYFNGGYTVVTIDGDRKTFESEVDPDLVGKRVRRDSATVLRALTLKDMECSEIQSWFKTSRQFVYTLRDSLLKYPLIRELRESL